MNSSRPTAPDRRRRRTAVGAAFALALLSAGLTGGWFAASHFQSPEQRDAQAKPPVPRDIVVEVKKGRLEQTINAPVAVAPAGVTTAAIPLNCDPCVVTAARTATGSLLRYGAVALEVNGRPMFAVAGAFPYYRDLTSGLRGPDVRQFQDMLRSLGYRIPTQERGTFGSATARAVIRWYASAGYDSYLLTAADAADDPTESSRAAESSDAAGRSDSAPPSAWSPARGSEASTGGGSVTVPLSDLLVVGGLPRTSVGIPGVGTRLTTDNARLSLSNGGLQLTSSVPAGTLAAIKAGSPALLTDQAGAHVTATATPRQVAPDATDGTIDYHLEKPLPSGWAKATIVAAITAVAVTDEETLIVPTRAIITRTGGATGVLRRGTDGAVREVAVTALGSLGGETAIRPTSDGTLDAGDEVVVR